MSHEEVATWLGIGFAILLASVLIFRSYRAAQARHAPIVRSDRELAKQRASRPPRTQHHVFAQERLRRVLATAPDGGFEHLARAEDTFLVDLWAACAPSNEELIPPTGLRMTVEDDIAIVTLPPPARTNEVYMVAVTKDGRYFVLERGEENAVLAEWVRDQRRRHGVVATPSIREMFVAVRGVLDGASATVPNT